MWGGAVQPRLLSRCGVGVRLQAPPVTDERVERRHEISYAQLRSSCPLVAQQGISPLCGAVSTTCHVPLATVGEDSRPGVAPFSPASGFRHCRPRRGAVGVPQGRRSRAKALRNPVRRPRGRTAVRSSALWRGRGSIGAGSTGSDSVRRPAENSWWFRRPNRTLGFLDRWYYRILMNLN